MGVGLSSNVMCGEPSLFVSDRPRTSDEESVLCRRGSFSKPGFASRFRWRFIEAREVPKEGKSSNSRRIATNHRELMHCVASAPRGAHWKLCHSGSFCNTPAILFGENAAFCHNRRSRASPPRFPG